MASQGPSMGLRFFKNHFYAQVFRQTCVENDLNVSEAEVRDFVNSKLKVVVLL